MKNILNRRSIRKYTKKQVSDNNIDKLLKAAMAAPSAGNQQPWEFIVIKDKNTLSSIKKIKPSDYVMLDHAPVAIMVCGNLEREIYKGYWSQDCSAATENILIATQSLELGAVWLGLYPEEYKISKIKNLIKLPEWIKPFSIISIGYPAEEKKPSKRFNRERIHYEKW